MKNRSQSLHFWSNFDHPFPPEDGLNRKRQAVVGKKPQALGSPNMSKSRLYLLSPFQEKHDYFLQYLGYYAGKQGSVTNQRVKIKIW